MNSFPCAGVLSPVEVARMCNISAVDLKKLLLAGVDTKTSIHSLIVRQRVCASHLTPLCAEGLAGWLWPGFLCLQLTGLVLERDAESRTPVSDRGGTLT